MHLVCAIAVEQFSASRLTCSRGATTGIIMMGQRTTWPLPPITWPLVSWRMIHSARCIFDFCDPRGHSHSLI